jgi:amino acid adenylation domain-containing protein
MIEPLARLSSRPLAAASWSGPVLAAYGLEGAGVTPLSEGVHATFRLDLERAEPSAGRYLLRLYGEGTHGVEAILSELAWLQALRRDAGLLVPEPVAARDGSPVVGVSGVRGEGGAGTRYAALFRWLDGQAPGGAPTAADCRRFGELMARLHRHGERFAPPSGFVRPRYDLDRLLGGAADGGLLAEAAGIVRPEIAGLGEGRDLFGLIHGDLQVTNFLFSAGRVAAIDFADSGWGYYPYDIASSLLPSWGHRDFPALLEAFLRGYRQVRPLPAAQVEKLEVFLVARALFVLRWTAENQHLKAVRESGAAIVPRLEAQILGFLDRRRPGAGRARGQSDAVGLLARLGDLGIRLWAEEGRLCFKAPQGTLTPALRAELAEHKAEILAFLEQTAARPEALAVPALPAITPVPRDHDLALSFAQQRLWLLDQLAPGNPAYNLSQILRLSGALRIAVLAQSLREVARRHESLRTTFRAVDGRPVQTIIPPRGLDLPVVDLGALPAAWRDRAAQELADREALQPFDLARGPVVRFHLLRLAATEHRLLFCIHHIASDGWSSGILIREMAGLYAAFSAGAAGRPSPFPDLAIQYADFAAWQREWLQGEVLAAEITYWQTQLQGAPDLLEIPTDRPRPPVQSNRGGREAMELSAATTAGLKSLGRGAGATLFMALFAAFSTLLFRLTGQGDVLVGSPIANRPNREAEGLIGFFVNTLVLRARLGGGMTFRELLAAVRQTTLDAYQHQDLPFEKLLEAMQPNRDASHTPLFQVMLTLQNAPVPVIELPGLALRFASPRKPFVAFDLEMNLQEGPAGLGGTWSYSTDLFDAATVRRLLRHFIVLTEAAVADPDRRLEELPMLTAAERHLALREWNDTATLVPWDLSFPALFAAQVERTPGALAAFVTAAGSEADAELSAELSYIELDRRADRVAVGLAERGVGPGILVALLAERGLDFLAAVLGILKAGGAYLPLDPRYPARRHAQVLAQSGAPFLLTATGFRTAASEALALMPAMPAMPAISADRQPRLPEVLPAVEDLLARPDGGGVKTRTSPSDLAYVIYTSGSTGLPKGAMIEQRGMVNHLFLKILTLGLTAADRVAQTASQTFDISIWQLFAALLVGGSIEIFPEEVVQDPPRLLSGVARGRITILEVVPTQLRALTEEVAGRPAGLPLPHLRFLYPNAEILPTELCRDWFKLYPAIPLVNPYGATECSDDMTHETIRSWPKTGGPPRVPIGRPVTNMRLHALDRTLEPLPIGVPGELWIGGVGVGPGYFGDPARTAEVFLPDPWGEPGARIYRTGDLGRQLPDGSFDFLGRIDHQVKVRGFRIELEEVESCLAQHPAVRESVALVEAGELGGTDGQLVVYLTVHPGADLTAEELRRFVGERLPAYMIPSIFVVLQAMPLNANGKIDRGALAGASGTRLRAAREAVAPRNPLEEAVAGLWRDVLGTAEVGVHDRFFDLGGHSLLATTLLSRVRQAFAVEVSLVTFFREPTVAGLAEAIAVTRQALEDLKKVRTTGRADEREEGEL